MMQMDITRGAAREIIHQLPFEVGFIFNGNKCIGVCTHLNSRNLNAEAGKDEYLIHNHPNDKPWSRWTWLSVPDINFTISNDLAGIEAVDIRRQRVWANRPENGWPTLLIPNNVSKAQLPQHGNAVIKEVAKRYGITIERDTF